MLTLMLEFRSTPEVDDNNNNNCDLNIVSYTQK